MNFKSERMPQKQILTILSCILLAVYAAILLLGLVHMSEMSSMDMSSGDCHASINQQSICGIAVSLQDIAVFLLPQFKVFLLALVFGVFYTNLFATEITQGLLYFKKERRRKLYFFQELFARGILNPAVH